MTIRSPYIQIFILNLGLILLSLLKSLFLGNTKFIYSVLIHGGFIIVAGIGFNLYLNGIDTNFLKEDDRGRVRITEGDIYFFQKIGKPLAIVLHFISIIFLVFAIFFLK